MYIWCACALHLTSWPSCWLHLKVGGGGISESKHIIWTYELISDVCFHLIWKRGGYIWICTLHLKNMNSYLMSVFTSSEKEGGISESVHFIWKYEFIFDACVHFILFTSSDSEGYILSQHSLHLKSWLSLLTLWALEHWTIYVDCSMLLSLWLLFHILLVIFGLFYQ